MRTIHQKSSGRATRFSNHAGGGASVQAALLFGAVAMALAVLAAPMLQSATAFYAENRAFGIDRVMTGSIEKGKRHTVRHSVLDAKPGHACADKSTASCDQQ